jgi:hypothetical protein
MKKTRKIKLNYYQNIGVTTPAQYWEEARQVNQIRIHPDCNPGTNKDQNPS